VTREVNLRFAFSAYFPAFSLTVACLHVSRFLMFKLPQVSPIKLARRLSSLVFHDLGESARTLFGVFYGCYFPFVIVPVVLFISQP
jgi:hypothetical protein